jgi:hypothetical protein
MLGLLAVRYLKAEAPPGGGRRAFVCVATGEVFQLNIDQTGMIPARNARTGQRTLLPCAMDDQGRPRVEAHYRAVLLERLARDNRFVDEDTLCVRQNE